MNGMAACLEYYTSSCMTPTFSSLDGHNAIWTSWDFLQIPTWPKPKTKNFLLWINSNRLCLHVGLEFWTIFSFTCSESTSFTTCKFCFTTLYLAMTMMMNYQNYLNKKWPWWSRLSCVRQTGWKKSRRKKWKWGKEVKSLGKKKRCWLTYRCHHHNIWIKMPCQMILHKLNQMQI